MEIRKALGTHRDSKQHELWIARESISATASHIIYDKLNGLLRSIGFDEPVESLCKHYYAKVT